MIACRYSSLSQRAQLIMLTTLSTLSHTLTCSTTTASQSILGALSADADTSEEEHFRLSLVTLDMERAKWLLRAYLRIRLIKIEEFSQFVSTAPPELRKLSEAERAYVQR